MDIVRGEGQPVQNQQYIHRLVTAQKYPGHERPSSVVCRQVISHGLMDGILRCGLWKGLEAKANVPPMCWCHGGKQGTAWPIIGREIRRGTPRPGTPPLASDGRTGRVRGYA